MATGSASRGTFVDKDIAARFTCCGQFVVVVFLRADKASAGYKQTARLKPKF